MTFDIETRARQLSEVQLDFVYVYPRASREQATEILSKIQDRRIDGRLFDDEAPFKKWCLENRTERKADLFQRATLCLFHVDNAIATDTEWKKALHGNLHVKPCIPVRFTPSENLSQEAIDALFNLKAIPGFDPSNRDFVDELNSELVNQRNKRDKETRKHEQAAELRLLLQRHQNRMFNLSKRIPIDRNFAPENADAGGTDLLSHKKYAEKIDTIIIRSPDWKTPSTIGILASWGSGKSYFLQQIKSIVTKDKPDLKLHFAEMKCCLTSRRIPALLKLFIYFAFAILLMAISFFAITRVSQEMETGMNNNKTFDTTTNSQSIEKTGESESITGIWMFVCIATPCFVVVVLILLGICQRKVLQCLPELDHNKESKYSTSDYFAPCYFSFLQPPASSLNEVQVIVVEFNAWLYSGCDVLWAGIVKELGIQIENYFGKLKVRYMRLLMTDRDNDSSDDERNKRMIYHMKFKAIKCCKMRHKYIVLFLLIVYVIAISIFVAIYFGSLLAVIATSVTLFIIAALASLDVAYIFTRNTVKTVYSVLNSKQSSQQGLGFMDEIKMEVELITRIVNFMSRVYGKQFRVLLIIDDLDRCKQDRIVGVLEAINLLLDHKNSPFISLLAIDPRIVLGAIERHFHPGGKADLAYAYVNGYLGLFLYLEKKSCAVVSLATSIEYEYLKKIVHLPFCLPRTTKEEKRTFLKHLFRSSKDAEQGTTNTSDSGGPSQESLTEQERTNTSDSGGPSQESLTEQGTTNVAFTLEIQTAEGENVNEEVELRNLTGEKFKKETNKTLKKLEEKLCSDKFSRFLDGNPRTMKRVYNVLLLTLNLYRGEERVVTGFEDYFIKVIIMVEQWPFRTSLLKILSDRQKDVKPSKLWQMHEKSAMNNSNWKKLLRLDYDSTLFGPFIEGLTRKYFIDFLSSAINYDHVLENIVKEGLPQNTRL